MGLFGFIENIVTATVKTVVVAPIAIVTDVLDSTPFEKTGDILDSAVNNVTDAIDELIP